MQTSELITFHLLNIPLKITNHFVHDLIPRYSNKTSNKRTKQELLHLFSTYHLYNKRL